MRLAYTLMQKLMKNLLTTIPYKKLSAIKIELQHTICKLEIKPVVGSANTGCVYINQAALVRIAEKAISTECFLCDKSAKECKRCQLYKDLNACFPYELCEPTDVKCPFAGISELQLEEHE